LVRLLAGERRGVLVALDDEGGLAVAAAAASSSSSSSSSSSRFRRLTAALTRLEGARFVDIVVVCVLDSSAVLWIVSSCVFERAFERVCLEID
jgi:hypothetical protein